MRRIHRVAVAALLVASLAAPAAAQQNQTVTQADIQRLQDNVYQADRDITQLRGRDATRATQLQTELDDLRDEVVYCKVKLRKERTLARTEYADVRDRIEDVRTRARDEATTRLRNTARQPAPRRRARHAAAPPPTRHDAAADAPRRATTSRSRGHRDGRAAAEQPELGHGAGRGSVRRHHARRPQRRRPHGDPRRLGDARRRHGGRAGDADQPHREDDGQLRSGDGQRPRLSDARHGDAGDRGRRHQG